MIHTDKHHDSDESDKKKTVLREENYNAENETSGETSSATEFDRSGFTKKTGRSNKPLGSSHEPGVTPGSEF
ncbi:MULTISPECIES: hypothetical protein [Pedobacter]|uniref:hypothetical protein n=1 Tax=Pedobacter TaxID=84567 RepID=UPI00210A9D5A|nr:MULTISPECIES: hypothetical protein [unclassified Pedobacter]